MQFGERVQDALEAETSPNEQLRAARTQLLERVTTEQRRTPKLRLQLALFGGLATLATAAAIMFTWSRPIAFETASGKHDAGDVLEALQHQPTYVHFSEGSQLLLHDGTRARVLETHARGARVLLENGAADVSIVHRSGTGTRWRFEAGPFQVLVTGTQFKLAWHAASQSLVLSMRSGSVELSGACLPAPRVVAGRETVRLSCAKPAQPASETRAAESAATATSAGAQPAHRAPANAARESAAQPRSFESGCETASKADLVAWANRERLAGSVVRARSALLTLRKRFGGSNEAATAAFTLGRIAYDQRADYAEAARWFATYLEEQPAGPLMGDAAGRLLEARARLGDRAAARRDAQAYLRRFPEGPYASQAKRILSE